jgi:hypothetical protein
LGLQKTRNPRQAGGTRDARRGRVAPAEDRIAIGTFTKYALDWIAIIGRDPIIFRNTPLRFI